MNAVGCSKDHWGTLTWAGWNRTSRERESMEGLEGQWKWTSRIETRRSAFLSSDDMKGAPEAQLYLSCSSKQTSTNNEYCTKSMHLIRWSGCCSTVLAGTHSHSGVAPPCRLRPGARVQPRQTSILRLDGLGGGWLRGSLLD